MSSAPSAPEEPIVCQMVAEAYHPGGLEKHFIEICNGLAGTTAVHAIAHESYRPHLRDGVIFHSFDLSRGRRNPWMLWQLVRLLRSLDADVVHAHAKKAGFILSQVARWVPQKTVVTLHNLTAARRWMANVDGIVCVSRTIADSLPGLPTHVVYNGIEPSHCQAPSRFVTQGPNVLAVGRLAVAKGFDILIEAFAGVEGHLHIAGEGPERERLVALAAERGLSDRVHFLGYRNDVPALIAAADLVVISSRREGFSYVFAEAMFARTPVISTEVPVPCEILPAEYLVPIGDVGALRKRIIATLDDLPKARAAFSPWFEFAREQFTVDAMTRNIRQVYRCLAP